MWSEENGPFNLVVILDENGAHDLDTATDATAFQTPQDGELVTKVSGIDISCHTDSPCIDAPLDCKDGTACTTITPIDHVDCRTPACQSESSFCKGGSH